jgi:hypothetical protein
VLKSCTFNLAQTLFASFCSTLFSLRLKFKVSGDETKKWLEFLMTSQPKTKMREISCLFMPQNWRHQQQRKRDKMFLFHSLSSETVTIELVVLPAENNNL